MIERMKDKERKRKYIKRDRDGKIENSGGERWRKLVFFNKSPKYTRERERERDKENEIER